MIELKDVAKTYRKGDAPPVKAIDNISLRIEQGEYVAILGPSGSGKSSLMNVLGLLDRADEGDYLLNGVSVRNKNENELARLRNEVIGFVFQAYHLLPRTTAIENVQLPLMYGNRPDYKQRSERALEAVGLGDRMHHDTSELSGGQRQRVAVARAIVNEPSIILADEPTGNLDSVAAEEVMRLFEQQNARGTSVVLITHDLDIAERAQRVLKIRDGRIVSDESRAMRAGQA
jgi:putative ABC transport system ATP-binding protein